MMGVRGVALEELLGELREKREQEEWGCRKMYPPEGKKGPITKVHLRVRDDRRNSPLRKELQPEDIEAVEEVDWKELMEDFDKPVSEGDIDGGTFMDFFEDRYGLYVVLSPSLRSMHSAYMTCVLAGDRVLSLPIPISTSQASKSRTGKQRMNL